MPVESWYFVARMSLGLILVWAALGKMRSIRQFIDGFRRYELVPRHASAPLAIGLLLTEFLVGIALIAGLGDVLSLTVSMLLFLGFCFAIARALRRGSDVTCNCFGSDEAEKISMFTLVRTTLLLALSGVALSLALHQTDHSQTDYLPALSIAAGVALFARLSGFVPLVLTFLRLPFTAGPPPTRRVSFRHQPMNASLRTVPARNNGSQPVASPTLQLADPKELMP